ncbi:peptidoglycan-binding domain-containing protein [Streptomyces shenzhenensis]|uniref:peptidoglycan-binding domain-containing protein n=1 Tax=Streptomyces TaxID=1883 RepID=UPI001F1D1676|nr:peptidoglycan-binding domain-containing protein [Streptomyces shenzhenensis]
MRRNRLLTSAAVLGAAVALGPAVPHTAAASGQNCSYVASGQQPTLAYGDTGAAVRQAQCLSNAWGGQPPKLALDGVYGTVMQKKVEWIQTCHGLPASGVIEGRTWHVLYHPALDCYVPYPS